MVLLFSLKNERLPGLHIIFLIEQGRRSFVNNQRGVVDFALSHLKTMVQGRRQPIQISRRSLKYNFVNFAIAVEIIR